MPLTEESKSLDSQNPPQNSDQTEPEGAGDSPPAFFREFSESFQKWREEVDGRFTQIGKDFGKMRSRFDRSKGSDSPEPKTPSNGGKEATPGDPAAIFRLGRLLGSLPEDVSTELEEMLAEGVSVKEVADRAEFAKRLTASATEAAKNGANPSKKTPPGRAATAPATSAKVHPSWAEWLQMNRDANAGDKAAKRRLRELDNDPTFDPDPGN